MHSNINIYAPLLYPMIQVRAGSTLVTMLCFVLRGSFFLCIDTLIFVCWLVIFLAVVSSLLRAPGAVHSERPKAEERLGRHAAEHTGGAMGKG